MRRQAELAIDTADVTVLVTDVCDGVVATDEEVAQMLQKSGKPVVLCVNKCDQIGEPPAQFYEFYNLGLGEPIQVSSVHGTGTGDLLEEVCKFLPPEDETELDEDVISVAVIGKPNVGKSSLINYITGENRCIVSDIAVQQEILLILLLKTNMVNSILLILPVCVEKPEFMTTLKSTVLSEPEWLLTDVMFV